MESVIQNWRLYESRYNLVGSFCDSCKKKFFPEVKVCFNCGSKKIKKAVFEKEGTVYSFSKVHVSQRKFQDQVPYVVALIKLKNGPIVTSQIVDSDFLKIKIGKKVKAVFRKIHVKESESAITYGIKFKLI